MDDYRAVETSDPRDRPFLGRYPIGSGVTIGVTHEEIRKTDKKPAGSSTGVSLANLV